jgi:phosphoketolase
VAYLLSSHVWRQDHNGFTQATTTPCDLVMLNDLDRYRLVIDVVDTRLRARTWTREHWLDLPEVSNGPGPAEPTAGCAKGLGPARCALLD